jgi:hypothetical protein
MPVSVVTTGFATGGYGNATFMSPESQLCVAGGFYKALSMGRVAWYDEALAMDTQKG